MGTEELRGGEDNEILFKAHVLNDVISAAEDPELAVAIHVVAHAKVGEELNVSVRKHSAITAVWCLPKFHQRLKRCETSITRSVSATSHGANHVIEILGRMRRLHHWWTASLREESTMVYQARCTTAKQVSRSFSTGAVSTLRNQMQSPTMTIKDATRNGLKWKADWHRSPVRKI